MKSKNNKKRRQDFTKLHRAMRENLPEQVRTLIDQGMDINAKDRDGKSPLQAAEERNNRKMVALLRRHGG